MSDSIFLFLSISMEPIGPIGVSYDGGAFLVIGPDYDGGTFLVPTEESYDGGSF